MLAATTNFRPSCCAQRGIHISIPHGVCIWCLLCKASQGRRTGLHPLGRTNAIVLWSRGDRISKVVCAISGLLQHSRSLEMAKHTHDPVKLADFEIKAQEFISLTFDLCEQELHLHRRHHTQQPMSRNKALSFATLSVQNSIKTFLAILQIETE